MKRKVIEVLTILLHNHFGTLTSRAYYLRLMEYAAIVGLVFAVGGLYLSSMNWLAKWFFYFSNGFFLAIFAVAFTFGRLTTTQIRRSRLSKCPGNQLLSLSRFIFCRGYYEKVVVPAISDMREEYFEALAQNNKPKALWVCIRGYYSFFAAIGLDRAFAFVSFFIKAWKSVN